MTEESDNYPRFAFAVCASLAVGGGLIAGGLAGCDPAKDPPDGVVSSRPSRSSTIALSDDGARVAMVNPDDGSLSVFQTTRQRADRRRSRPAASPSSVVIAPDGKTAFVANRADGTVVRVDRHRRRHAGGRRDASSVGAEPVALALSPTGKQLFVAEFAESRVVGDRHRDDDRSSSSIAGRPPARAARHQRRRRERRRRDARRRPSSSARRSPAARRRTTAAPARSASTRSPTSTRTGDIALAPLDSGFPKGGVAGEPDRARPRRTSSRAVADRAGPALRHVRVGLAGGAGALRQQRVPGRLRRRPRDRHRGRATRAARRTSRARSYDAIPTPSPAQPALHPRRAVRHRLRPGTSNVAYAVGRAGDVMLRVTFGDDASRSARRRTSRSTSPATTRIGKCQDPTGVAVDRDATRAYVNCWVTRRLGVVDLDAQALTHDRRSRRRRPATRVEQSVAARQALLLHRPRPLVGRAVAQRREGRRGLVVVRLVPPRRPDRQHHLDVRRRPAPDHLAGRLVLARPRPAEAAHLQLDRHLRRAPRLRAQHARRLRRPRRDHHGRRRSPTATSSTRRRQVSLAPGGVADRRPRAAAQGARRRPRDRAVRPQGLGRHRQLRARRSAGRARRAPPMPHAVERGRQLFVDGGCAKCHGGAGWTVSRRFFTPTRPTNAQLATTPFARPAFFPATWIYDNGGDAAHADLGAAARSRSPTRPARPSPRRSPIAAGRVRRCATSARSACPATPPAPTRSSCGRAGQRSSARRAAPATTCRRCTGSRSARRTCTTARRRRSTTCSPTRAGAFHTNAGNANFSVAARRRPASSTT